MAGLLWTAACGPAPGPSTEASSQLSANNELRLTSSAFTDGGAIPRHNTCDGDDVSPPLSWGPAPPGTGAWVLIVDDPDAGGWVHWVVVNLAANVTSLDEGASGNLPAEAVEGGTDFGSAKWGGPCPPSGEHRYVFTIYALAEPLELGPEVTATQLREDMSGKILGEGTLTGTYRR